MSDQHPFPEVAALAGTGVEDMELNFTKGQKVRAVALMLAMRYHDQHTIHDADYLKEIHQEKSRRGDNKPLSPITNLKVVSTAAIFEQFLKGDLSPSLLVDENGNSISLGTIERQMEEDAEEVLAELAQSEEG